MRYGCAIDMIRYLCLLSNAFAVLGRLFRPLAPNLERLLNTSFQTARMHLSGFLMVFRGKINEINEMASRHGLR